jgi:hypothetical protein
MSVFARQPGFLVVDRDGRLVGRVERAMPLTTPGVADSLSVKTGFLGHRHRLVPSSAIEVVDPSSRVVGLRVGREAIRYFP